MSDDDLREYLVNAYGSANRLYWYLRGGHVRRFHTEPLNGQLVAAHSWRVRIIIDYLWPKASEQLKDAAIYHDVAEGLLGDIPAPIKRHPNLSTVLHDFEHEFERFLGIDAHLALNQDDAVRLKIADYAELVLTVDEQSPHRAAHVRRNGLEYIQQSIDKLPDVNERDRLSKSLAQLISDNARISRGAP
jgi:hypothetical protein